MIRIELTEDEAVFLRDLLALRARASHNELVHTDDRTMRADIVRDLERLQTIQERVGRVLAS